MSVAGEPLEHNREEDGRLVVVGGRGEELPDVPEVGADSGVL